MSSRIVENIKDESHFNTLNAPNLILKRDLYSAKGKKNENKLQVLSLCDDGKDTIANFYYSCCYNC